MTVTQTKESTARPAPADAAGVARVPALRPAAPPPARKRRLWAWALAGVLGLGGAGFGIWQVWMGQPLPVLVEILAPAPVTRVLAVNGRMAALQSVDVRSVVTGSLTALPVAEGDLVAKDQILAQVDAATQNAVVRQAMAALDTAILVQQQASETYDRSVSLGGNVTRTALEADAYALQSAEREVARLTALLEQAQTVLETYTTRAPVAGTVLTLDAELGQIVGPSTALLTLADLGTLVVEADVDEAYATQIRMGQQAVLQLAGESATHQGHVSFVSNRVDAATGGLAIKIGFDSPVSAPVGLSVAANIIVDERSAALTVPRTALVDGGAVLVVSDGIAERRPVTVVDWPAARLIVTSGLNAGETVIVDVAGMAEGQTVVVDHP